jgi:hypothetical protein
LRALPERLGDPVAVYLQPRQPPRLIYVYDSPDGLVKVAVGIDYGEKSLRQSALSNAIMTADRVTANDVKSLGLILIKQYPQPS